MTKESEIITKLVAIIDEELLPLAKMDTLVYIHKVLFEARLLSLNAAQLDDDIKAVIYHYKITAKEYHKDPYNVSRGIFNRICGNRTDEDSSPNVFFCGNGERLLPQIPEYVLDVSLHDFDPLCKAIFEKLSV